MKHYGTLILAFAAMLAAAAEPPKELDDFSRPGILQSFAAIGQKNAAFRVVDGENGKAVRFTATPGDTLWPGGALVAPEGGWDLSKYGTIEAKVYNPNEEKLRVWMRVDDCSGLTRRTQNLTFGDIPPKSSAIVRLYFTNNGYGRNYILDTTRISQVFFYLYALKKPFDLRIDFPDDFFDQRNVLRQQRFLTNQQACFIVYITRLLSAHLPVSFYLFSVSEDKPCTGHRQSACAFLRHDDKIKEKTRIRREGKEKILCDIRHFRTCSCPRWAWDACVCR